MKKTVGLVVAALLAQQPVWAHHGPEHLVSNESTNPAGMGVVAAGLVLLVAGVTYQRWRARRVKQGASQ